jgi:hypothetical protein
MGESFGRLHPAIQAFHRLNGSHRLSGWVATDAPASSFARALAWLIRSPLHDSGGAFRLWIDAGPQTETWVRRFRDGAMPSRIRAASGRLVEQMGAVRLIFELEEADGRLQMHLVEAQVLGLRWPRWLMPTVQAEERGSTNEVHFDVRAALPGIGTVTSYRGWLVVMHRPD